MTKKIAQSQLSHGGKVHLENKIYWYHGRPRRDQGILTKLILAWEGVTLEKKKLLAQRQTTS